MSRFAAADAADLACQLQDLKAAGDRRQRNLKQLGQILALGLRKRPKRVLDLRIQRFVIAPRRYFPIYSVIKAAYRNLCVGFSTELTNLLNAIS